MRLSIEWETGTIDAFSTRVGETLVISVRNMRRLGLKPSLALSYPEFMTLLDHWPQFYLLGPVVKTRTKDNLWSWLRRLFVRKRRVSPSIRFSDEALDKVKGQMLRLQAIPVDGVWVPVYILGSENTNDD